MLKTCVLPTYLNFTNKSCGEIFCQTENTFTIVCKLCDIKIFDYNEFLKHVRVTHWSEIFEKSYRGIHSIESNWVGEFENCELKKIVKTEKEVIEIKDEVKIEEHDFTLIEDYHSVLNDNEENRDDIEPNNEENDSEDSLGAMVILKKRCKSDTKKEKHECDLCSRKFTTKFYLRFHMRQQHEPKNFHCDKCNKSFLEKRYLMIHQRSHSGYSCGTCNKVFDKYEALRYHCESHIETRNFICDYENCNKAFPNNRRLSAHKRSHFAQPSFVCEICGSRQRSKEFLIVHIRTHTGEKPFSCDQCNRRFASKHFLQDHQAVHATERLHVCSVCGKAFASSKSLYHHRHLHSGVKKYICKICSSAYTQAAGLSAHMRKHKQDSGLLELENTFSDKNLLCD